MIYRESCCRLFAKIKTGELCYLEVGKGQFEVNRGANQRCPICLAATATGPCAEGIAKYIQTKRLYMVVTNHHLTSFDLLA